MCTRGKYISLLMSFRLLFPRNVVTVLNCKTLLLYFKFQGTQRENVTDEMSTLINSWSEAEVHMEPSPDPAKAGKHKRV